MQKQTPKKFKGRQSRKGKKTMEVSESWIRKQATKLQLTIKEAAEFIGKGQQYVRVGLQEGRLNFGTAVPKFKDENEREARRRAGKRNWDYDIQRIQVERYVGMTYRKFLEMKYINQEKDVNSK